jgi:hypothetical protein
MSDDRFWALIETTTKFESDPQQQLTALRDALGKYSVEEVEAFESAKIIGPPVWARRKRRPDSRPRTG